MSVYKQVGTHFKTICLKALLTEWISKIKSASEHPCTEIKAFNFGLVQTENGYSVYLIGSKTYDQSDNDWACEEDYSPEPRYLNLPTEYSNMDWEELQETFSKGLREFLESIDKPSSIFANAIAVTTGFDDGELDRVL